jgi:hypothetical protein
MAEHGQKAGRTNKGTNYQQNKMAISSGKRFEVAVSLNYDIITSF